VQRRNELLPRFAGYYQRLCTLPRRVRRALQRQWKQSLAGVALLLALGVIPAEAAIITVGGNCSLINAITAANTDTATGGCKAGNGADTIKLPNNSLQLLSLVNNITQGNNGLPVVTSIITIQGNNSTIARAGFAADPFRILMVGSGGNLTLNETTISEGQVPSGVSDGGGINNEGTLTLTGSTLLNNSAGDAGGGLCNIGSVTIQNSTFSGNSAGFQGGGIYNKGTLTLTDSILSNNSAADNGGGVKHDEGS
jgi:predicted outer membrane repeat protein